MEGLLIERCILDPISTLNKNEPYFFNFLKFNCLTAYHPSYCHQCREPKHLLQVVKLDHFKGQVLKEKKDKNKLEFLH